jgi:hypothetical protein
MVSQDSLLVTLVILVDRLPSPTMPVKRGRGRPTFYPDHLFLKALVIMIVRHLHTVHELLTVLEQPTEEMQTLRVLLSVQGRFPPRRTWERRLKRIPATLPAQIGCLGRHLVSLIQPWSGSGRAVAIDSTILRARGGVWHHKHREKGELPHTSIDTEAHWTKSGWHALVYGWKLHVVSVVAAVWFPIAAVLPLLMCPIANLLPISCGKFRLTSALCWVIAITIRLISGISVRKILACSLPPTMDTIPILMMASRCGASSISCVPSRLKILMNTSKASLMAMDKFPPKACWLPNASRKAAIFVYQLAFVYRFEHDLDLCVGLKAFLKAA